VQVGADGFRLLDVLARSDAPLDAAALPAIKTLRRVWARHFERVEGGQDGGARLRPVRGRGPGDRLESPYDTEARYRTKASTTWTGYMVHFTETCDPGAPRLVVHADTTPANVHDALRTAPIQAALAGKGLAPSEHLVDSAYVSAGHLITARERHGIDLVGPTRQNLSWQSHTEGAFSAADFTLDWDRQKMRCPEGKESAGWCKVEGIASVVMQTTLGMNVYGTPYTRSARLSAISGLCRLCGGPEDILGGDEFEGAIER